jgi:N utilization substance protein A
VVPDEQLSLAIGRRGQNVRLASQLTGWQFDLMTEAADSERRQREFKERTDLFQKALDADETLAQLLASEGFETVEEIAYVEIDQLASIEGFDEEVASELQQRAREYLEKLAAELDAKRKELGVADEVAFMENVTPQMAVKFGENGVKTIEDLAGLVPDDLVGWKEPGPDGKPKFVPGLLEKGDMSRDDAELFILKARVVAGWVEPKALEDALAARAAALDAEEAELEAAEQAPAETARSRGDELFNLKGANAASSEQ